ERHTRCAAIPTRPSANGVLCWLKSEESRERPLVARQLVLGQAKSPQVMECRFIIGNRHIESRETRCKNFDAIKLGTRSIKGAIEFISDLGNCRIRSHRPSSQTLPLC